MVVKNQENYDNVTEVNTKIIVSGVILAIITAIAALFFNLSIVEMDLNESIASAGVVFMLGFTFVMIVSNIYCAFKLLPDMFSQHKKNS